MTHTYVTRILTRPFPFHKENCLFKERLKVNKINLVIKKRLKQIVQNKQEELERTCYLDEFVNGQTDGNRQTGYRKHAN